MLCQHVRLSTVTLLRESKYSHMSVTEHLKIHSFHTAQIKESYVSGNTTKESYPLRLNLLCNLCPITKEEGGGSNQDFNYCMYVKIKSGVR
jgi:hypothetical protein